VNANGRPQFPHVPVDGVLPRGNDTFFCIPQVVLGRLRGHTVLVRFPRRTFVFSCVGHGEALNEAWTFMKFVFLSSLLTAAESISYGPKRLPTAVE